MKNAKCFSPSPSKCLEDSCWWWAPGALGEFGRRPRDYFLVKIIIVISHTHQHQHFTALYKNRLFERPKDHREGRDPSCKRWCDRSHGGGLACDSLGWGHVKRSGLHRKTAARPPATVFKPSLVRFTLWQHEPRWKACNWSPEGALSGHSRGSSLNPATMVVDQGSGDVCVIRPGRFLCGIKMTWTPVRWQEWARRKGGISSSERLELHHWDGKKTFHQEGVGSGSELD